MLDAVWPQFQSLNTNQQGAGDAPQLESNKCCQWGRTWAPYRVREWQSISYCESSGCISHSVWMPYETLQLVRYMPEWRVLCVCWMGGGTSRNLGPHCWGWVCGKYTWVSHQASYKHWCPAVWILQNSVTHEESDIKLNFMIIFLPPVCKGEEVKLSLCIID
jgi:hypothetical protein